VKRAGHVVLFRFPQTDLTEEKLRPALLLGKLPGRFNDWLICMITSQLHHEIEGFDELLLESDSDFDSSGLKAPSLVRVGRLAVVEEASLLGAIGAIGSERLERIRYKLANWLTEKDR